MDKRYRKQPSNLLLPIRINSTLVFLLSINNIILLISMITKQKYKRLTYRNDVLSLLMKNGFCVKLINTLARNGNQEFVLRRQSERYNNNKELSSMQWSSWNSSPDPEQKQLEHKMHWLSHLSLSSSCTVHGVSCSFGDEFFL